jgi:C-terminal processing protease CtpA/Prc
MRAALFLVLATLVAFGENCTRGGDATAQRPVQNLRTLAKLYGYLRYFQPSDEAARVDWDALAVLAAGKVRSAADPGGLKAALVELFRPVAPAMVLSLKDEKPAVTNRAPAPPDSAQKFVSWQHFGLGTASSNSLYKSIRLNRPYESSGQAQMRQALDAAELRGKKIKLSAWVKALPGNANSQVQLWLRVDTPSGPGFFDNMNDRPIKAPQWAEYTIAGPVAADAQRIVFGVLVYGRGRFYIDGFRLSATDASGHEEPLAVRNGGFEEGKTGAAPLSWSVESPAMDFTVQEAEFREGKRALSFATKVLPFTAPLFEKQAPADGLIEKEIGQGIFCRIPLALATDGLGTLPRSDPKDLDRLRADLDKLVRVPLSARTENVRLGDVIIAWNVFQHFYPYFDVVQVDWDEALVRSLEKAMADRTEEDFFRTMRWMVARLEDGHGGVYHALLNKIGWPPFRVEWVEGKMVVTSSRDALFHRGDIVLSLDGKDTARVLGEEEEGISGSPQWRRFRSTGLFGSGPVGTKSRLKIWRGREVRELDFERSAKALAPDPPGHPPIDQLAAGVLYVDLSRASWPEIKARIQDLASARGVVFDLRGYPNSNHMVLRHLLRAPDTSSAWMKIPLIVLPDREGWNYQEVGWNLSVATPHIGGRVVFLTDGRAISYAESFLSFVEHYKLGEIVGEPTAGANGNVNSFILPGGFTVTWTGMKVVKHDGSQHHTVGVLPTILFHRTLAGVAAGKDEYLEKALEIINKYGAACLATAYLFFVSKARQAAETDGSIVSSRARMISRMVFVSTGVGPIDNLSGSRDASSTTCLILLRGTLASLAAASIDLRTFFSLKA